MHLSNLKVINFHSAFKLAVHSSAVVSFLDLPENLCELLMDLLLSFLSMLHVPCWCLHVFVILLVQYTTSNVPQIFSVCNILQQYVCFHALFLTDLHFFFLIFLFSPYKYNLNFWWIVELSAFIWSNTHHFEPRSMLLLSCSLYCYKSSSVIYHLWHWSQQCQPNIFSAWGSLSWKTLPPILLTLVQGLV